MILYKNTKTIVFSPVGNIQFFDIVTGVLQGDTLAPCMFILKKRLKKKYYKQTIFSRNNVRRKLQW